jgi:integrase
LELKGRKHGPDVWVFRFYEQNADGSKTDRSVLLGSTIEYSTRSLARQAAERKALVLLANPDHISRNPVSVGMLLGRYLMEEIPDRYSTARSYRSYIRKWIERKWKDYALGEVKSLAVETWLGSLPLAPKSRRHLRGIMRAIFQCALRWELIGKNPIDLVRVKGGTKRRQIPRILQPEDFSRLLQELRQPYRTMFLIGGGLGLRASEIVALKWGDLDWEGLTVTVTRRCVQGRVGEVKTEYSHRPLPLDPDLATEILRWRNEASYPNKGRDDFMFPNLATGKPMWQESILARQIKPSAVRAGLGAIGWHTFRHSHRAWLKRTNAPMEIQQELMRHANIQTTLDTYGKETKVSDQQREAHTRVVKMILPK